MLSFLSAFLNAQAAALSSLKTPAASFALSMLERRLWNSIDACDIQSLPCGTQDFGTTSFHSAIFAPTMC